MKKYLALSFIVLALAYPAYAWWAVGMTGGKVTAAAATTVTLGNESQGATSYGGVENYIYCGKLTELTPTTGNTISVNSVTMTLGSSSGTRYFTLSIYSHDAVNDLPESLVTNSVSTEMSVASTKADNTFTYSTKPTLSSNSQYWVCYHDKSYLDYFGEDTGGRSVIASDTYADGPAATFTNSPYGTNDRNLGKANIVVEY